MKRTVEYTAGAIAFTFLMACSASSQVVNIWPGVAPGSENWTQKERTIDNTPLGTVVFNVVTPTLTAYLPERSRATGTGVIIAPGGAFVALAIDLEGTMSRAGFRKKASPLLCSSIGSWKSAGKAFRQG